MVVLPYLSAIRFSGEDAGQFLHNQLSADVLALANGESIFACYCEPKGRVLALMLVSKHDSDYCVVMSSALVSPVSARLKIYVMRSKVNIEPLSEYAVSGAWAEDVSELAPASVFTLPVPSSNQRLLVAKRDPVSAVDERRINAWKISELKRGVTWLSNVTSGEFLPQMLGFDQLGAVNYRKGCYPGQEIVARTHYLGKVKRHPRILHSKLTQCPDPLEKIQLFSGDEGHEAVVTDCVSSETNGTCLLVVTRMEPALVADRFEYRGEITTLAIN